MSDKAIYSVDTVETITDNDKIYVNTGDNIKQIKSSDLFIDINSNLVEQKMLGWTVPSECPVQNTVSGNTFTQRVGRVDLGSLNWVLYSGNVFIVDNFGNGAKSPIENYIKANIYCNKYKTDYWYYGGEGVISRDNEIALNQNALYVHDSAFTDATSFKNAMQGEYLYYELATPITMTIDGNEAVTKINESLSDYGLVNQFDGLLELGGIDDSGNKTERTDCARSINSISCKTGDVISGNSTVLSSSNHAIAACFFNGTTFLSKCNITNGSVIAPNNATNFIIMIYEGVQITLSSIKVNVYVNNAIDELKNDLSTKIYELDGNKLWLCVSGKNCVLTLNGYNLTGSTNFGKLAEYPPYLVARNIVSKTDGVCMIGVESNGNISASDLQVSSSVTGQIFGEVSWVANI